MTSLNNSNQDQNPNQSEGEDKTRLEAVWTYLLARWVIVQPKLEPHWLRFKAFNEKVFALSDHSSLRGSRILLRVLLVTLATLFLWAAFFRIDQVVNAQGQIIASSKTQIIQAADGGILTEMRVQEGDEVKAGQVIAILEKIVPWRHIQKALER